ncbi:zinc-binding dehydrogenase [bacterium]|nr:zinc-binding dehydrogenase [bacterium]
MKILLSEAPGGPQDLRLRMQDDPMPGPGQVRLQMRCVGINFPDTLIIEDRYQLKPQRPFAPGAELCGTVDMLGEGVQDLAIGDRVMALPMWGALAEKVCVEARLCQQVPDEVTDAEAASLQVTYGTALYALEERGALKPGEAVLVLGAAGGVGLAAVELAKVLGARVVAAVSAPDKLQMALDHGADAGLVYARGPLDRDAQNVLNGQLRAALGPQGADIIVDNVGGDYAEPALRCMGWGGRFLVVGFPAGIPRIAANLILLKSCDVRGIFWGASVQRDPDGHRRAMARLLQMCAEGRIRPRIHASYPLERGAEAIAALTERNVMGKVVVTP